MCKKSRDKTTGSIGLPQVILPFLAGLTHLHVVYFAAFKTVLPVLLGDVSRKQTEDFQSELYYLDRAVFIAYFVDLFCCYFKALPFSRCNRSKDIIEHHLPTLLLALPLAVPTWAKMDSIESSLPILSLGEDSEIRDEFIKGCMMASGFAYISSMNEVFMCFQRVEMSLQKAATFADIPQMKHHFFTSRLIIGMELCYKLAFFWGLSILACYGCVKLPYAVYQMHMSNDELALWQVLFKMIISPIVLRALLFLTFSVVMYPSMGKRCLRKVKQFFAEGKEKTA
ncbi:unnamed protein product [Cylindrotheca closterium]|uniref:TLC domain-containing protein n=1 Tax=Cylindrotheca closterium TaxID=2856 RepID=A0AAD2FQ17_9STRA|nr:unnamed protein product [Cylindrotheca closterium]